MPLSIRSFPRAILHIDGDSFFASCEIAVNPALRGKPVITGSERGIVSSATYDLKRLGVKVGSHLSDVRKLCPDVIMLPSDYETYSLFSRRMYDIVRRYTSEVEEYSIDECFADITGMRRPLGMSYEEIAEKIKRELDSELGITFSVGLGPNKVLAKVGSKWRKPDGLTIIPGTKIEAYLRDLKVERIWGIGPQTTAFLQKQGITTALEYALMSRAWVDEHMSKPYREIWEELRGEFVYPLTTGEKHDYQSISKTKTFTPPSSDRAFVFSQLSKNIENACIKARRHNLAPSKVFFFLKTQEFRYAGLELTLSSPLALPSEIIRLVRGSFDRVFRPRTPYRATGVVLMNLEEDRGAQLDLFGTVISLEKWKPVFASVDALDSKFGKHTVFLGSSVATLTANQHEGERGALGGRSTRIFRGENRRQRVGLPMIGEVK